MAFKVKFPIRTKLIVLISGAVLVATTAYFLLAMQLFKDDKVQLVYELNASTVKTLASETKSQILKIADKIKLLTQGHRDSNWIHSVFESEADLVAYTLYRQGVEAGNEGWSIVSSIKNTDYLKLYGLPDSEIERIREKLPLPFASILNKSILLMNSTLPGGAPILTLAMSIHVVSHDGSVGKYVAVADIKMEHLLKLIGDRSIATVYVVDSEGKVLAHPDIKKMTGSHSLGDIPIVRDAISSPVTLQLKRFAWNGVNWLGAFASVGIGGAYVISQVPEVEAFQSLQELLKKSVLFALLVITVSIFISGWVAVGFTDPIQKLLEATDRIAQWDFSYTIHVKTADEIGGLARAFNAMSSHLQTQRLQIESNQAELERKVLERTQSLESEKKKLAEAQDALIRTTRLASLGELAGAAAHEVLNPVNNMSIRIERMSRQLGGSDKEDIGLMSEIISSWNNAYLAGGWASLESELKKPADEPIKTLGQEDLENLMAISGDLKKRTLERAQDMEFLGKEIVRITRIINNMRALSRVGGERRPLDIHVPIDETVLTLSDLFKKKNVDLVKDFSSDPRDLFSVIGDKDELVQVFSNLLRNSLHAVLSANRRAGVVRLATRSANNRVEIRIVDNGTGISKENLSRLFEPNFTTKSVDEGTGLGLSISRRLVRAFGGDLELEKTEEGSGSSFLIWFPKSL